MRLAAGARLGPYEILAPLGAGGMGEVYKATDTRLGRTVALKVLPEDFLEGEERRQRFEREARTLASLSHPNIAVVHSFEEIPGSPPSSSIPILTMELLEGESIRAAISRGSLPVRRALEIAEQVAQGLGAAHEKGIVHRDVKPENVFVTNDGHVKVLDFGLARAGAVPAGRDETESPTVEKLTTGGAVVGTVAYMSPEQARGLAVDHRSDQFSLGVVLYEMLCGRRPFKGASAVETLTAIIREEPEPLSREGLPIPAPVRWVVERCLAKEPVDRYDSTRDLARELASCRAHLSEAASGATFSAETRPAHITPRRRTLLLSVLVVVLVGAALAGGILIGRGRERQSVSPPRFSFQRLTSIAGSPPRLSISPRGDTVAYAAEKAPGGYHIFTLRVGGRNPVDLLPDFGGFNGQPSYSPDGSSIAFRSTRDGGGIFVMGATGESPRRLTTFGHAPAWFPDGRRIAFSSVGAGPYSRFGNGALWTVDAPGGTPKKLYDATDAVQPSVSPHGFRIAFWGVTYPRSTRDVFTIAVEAQAGVRPVPVTQDDATDWSPFWSPDGRFLYFASDRSGVPNLWRIPIDERSGRVLGAPEPVQLPGVVGSSLSISADGRRIAYGVNLSEDAIERVPFDPAAGKVSGNPTVVVRGTDIACFGGISPNGEVLTYWEGRTGEDVWLVRSDGTGIRRLTDDAKNNRWSRFSADGKRIYFQSIRVEPLRVWSIGTDGSGLTEIIRHPTGVVGEPLPSPDGRSLAVFSNDEGPRVVPLPTAPDTPLPPLLPALGADLFFPWSWSPDSRRLLGTATKKTEGSLGAGLYVFDIAAREYTKLRDTGLGPQFLPDGRQILFQEGRSIFLFDLNTRAVREVLSASPDSVIGLSAVAPDGRSFYVVRTTPRSEIWTADFSAPPPGLKAP